MIPSFDRAALMIAGRNTLASLLALTIATLLHVPSPWWAAMTIWAVAQPSRGMWLEKSLARLVGSFLGAAAGAAMLWAFADNHLALIVALALWMGFWAGIGNWLRNLAAYCAMLAGYTAAIVALLALEGHHDPLQLALARGEGAVIGVLCSLLVGWAFVPVSPFHALAVKLREQAAVALALAADAMDPAATGLAERRAELVRALARIEAGFEEASAGSPVSRRRMRYVYSEIASLLSFIAEAKRLREAMGQDAAGLAPLQAALRRAETHLLTPGETRPSLPMVIEGAEAAKAAVPALGEPIDAMRRAFTEAALDHRALTARHAPRPAHRPAPHREGALAWRAALRAGLTVLAGGLFWVLSGWEPAAFAVMGACIFSSLFSIFEDPQRALRKVALGVSLGALAAVGFRLFLMPLAHDLPTLLLMMAPFMLLGAIGLTRPATAPYAMDYSMVFLLVSQPALGVVLPRGELIEGAIAIVLGALLAMAAFHLFWPVTPAKRTALLAMAIEEDIAEGRPARLHRRLLRLGLRGGEASTALIERTLGALAGLPRRRIG
ncbi:FUSC family protein [Acetobacteraceae bacterium H6797]|nr:FUSC family protein [Acetobacteraceae bacterium H6797]